MVSPWMLYASSGVLVVGVALHGLFSREGVVKQIIAANLLGSGIFLILVSLAHRAPAPFPDPVLHALVLTGIVISVSATALALALARRLAGAEPDGDPPPARPDPPAMDQP